MQWWLMSLSRPTPARPLVGTWLSRLSTVRIAPAYCSLLGASSRGLRRLAGPCGCAVPWWSLRLLGVVRRSVGARVSYLANTCGMQLDEKAEEYICKQCLYSQRAMTYMHKYAHILMQALIKARTALQRWLFSLSRRLLFLVLVRCLPMFA